ncbi:hypothetical protein PIB30_061677 [Stylosanthes scabra]|uniref:Protein FAR1-RELATED SEQUENCE n=1 Tax=Stylosanthes scabra TaxID=79078 RepID=A0ABU6VJV6_9FABA|nr:hypothetical protein [Stylosanthes scabra]
MGRKPPRGIITDQCPSMPNAISKCMPTTIRRWCIWHIMKKKACLKKYGTHALANMGCVEINGFQEFDNCLGRKEQKDREADAGDFYTNVPCATNSGIESQFQRVYTNAKFRELQTQFREKANCVATCKECVPGFVVYKRRHTSIKSSDDEPSLEPRNINYDVMISRSKVHCEAASGCEVLTAMEKWLKEHEKRDFGPKLDAQAPKPTPRRGRMHPVF